MHLRGKKVGLRSWWVRAYRGQVAAKCSPSFTDSNRSQMSAWNDSWPNKASFRRNRRRFSPMAARQFVKRKVNSGSSGSRWGTFLLVVVAAGARVVGAQSDGAITLSMQVIAPGLMVMAIIYFMGAVGGAHLNPAITLAFAARRNFPWARVPGYIAAQFVGGIAAAAFLRAMFGTIGLLGATTPGHGISEIKAFIMEILLTTGLVSTILGTASGARNVGSNGALAIGGYIALAGLWAEPISGASMNPVRSFAPDLIRGSFLTTWIYVAGPVLGAIIAVGFEWILKGSATAAGAVAAQGEVQSEVESQVADKPTL
jgi:aquaporin Z